MSDVLTLLQQMPEDFMAQGREDSPPEEREAL
jgi:virulence-associated protein VagC